MPNLKQILNLKERYGDTILSNLRKEDIQQLLESFDPLKIKQGGIRQELLTKSFSFPDFHATNYVDYFLQRKKTDVVLLFIDITAFSRLFVNSSSDQLADYLDKYYHLVIPIVNSYGGEIEKIMGDGIICVFGEPFLQEDCDQTHHLAESCARELILKLKKTDFAIKISLHFGEVMYYQNPTDEYFEYTMIGNAITELFRLESVSVPNSINFYTNTYIDCKFNFSFKTQNNLQGNWKISDIIKVNLSGVSFSSMRYIEAL